MAVLSTADIRSVDFGIARKKGYDTDEVNAFIEDVLESVADGNERARIAQERVESLEARIAELEEQASQSQERARSLESEEAANRAALSEAAAGLASAQEAMISMQAEVEQLRAGSGVSDSVKLLTSAQATAADAIARAKSHADEVRAAADEHSNRVRAEADEYAHNARVEADNYRENLRAVAEHELADLRAQAGALREGEAAYRSRVSAVLRSALEFVEGPVEGSELPPAAGASMEGMFSGDGEADIAEPEALDAAAVVADELVAEAVSDEHSGYGEQPAWG